MAPKTIDTGDQSIGGPRYMRSMVSLDDSGNMQVRTNTFSHWDLRGFTGGVLVSLSDAQGKLLYITPIVSYGVDGRLVFWSVSNRWDNEYYNVGADVARQVDRVDVWQGPTPKNRLVPIVNDLIIIVRLVAWLIEQWQKSSGDDGGSGDGPVQTTRQGLSSVRGSLLTRVDPQTLPFGTPTTFTVAASDTNSGAPVDGVVYRTMSLPLDRAGVPLGPTNAPLSATLTGKWISKKRVEIDPDSGRKIVIVVRNFVQEQLFVRTVDYGDAEVPVTLTGAPTDPIDA
ncbi:hypothetical protein KZZ52_14390 [Dactylosporangium sp. AC04546]|uniref:hypothetical protein n=1 Tax=Dactylosporangium sp. AC04546 TaxID=2862460 RepID=UPI001EE09E06|nr:hypothetical protein [Dactylosporangium sp. AC04546]WVK86506.1 hypothetical protein KZZ52_14390 [Dactylosporangium sp. AC04546]